MKTAKHTYHEHSKNLAGDPHHGDLRKRAYLKRLAEYRTRAETANQKAAADTHRDPRMRKAG